jgi:hypothetical protein
MRCLTRDMQRKMQFFSFAFEGMDLLSLIEEWSKCEHPLDVYEVFYQDAAQHKEDMIRLLPEHLKSRIFNGDGSIKKDILNEDLYRELVHYRQE